MGRGGCSKRKRRGSARSNKSSRDAVQSEQTDARRRGPKGKKTRRERPLEATQKGMAESTKKRREEMDIGEEERGERRRKRKKGGMSGM